MFDSISGLKDAVFHSGLADSSETLASEKKWYRALSQRAAVCMIVSDHPQLGPSLLMIQRAIHAGDPWSGQMAFPGGKHETDDAHITATALRELEEELSISDQYLRRFARLSDILARPYRPLKKPMVVTPLLFESSVIDLNPKPNHEVADVLWVPLQTFHSENRQTMQWKKNGVPIQLPCYYFEDKKIWGLSLMMIDELLSALRQ